jgi:Leucine-rich repeat (LRR) protein
MTRKEVVRQIERAAEEKLIELDLHGLELKELPPKIAECMQLESLLLGAGYVNNEWLKNKLTKFPDAVLGLTYLKKLDLSYNQITKIPKQLGQLSHLTKLWLSNNQIIQIPEQLGQLSNLTKLDLSNNQISSIPEQLGQLSNLAWLDLDGNQITEIPEALRQLPRLEISVAHSRKQKNLRH